MQLPYTEFYRKASTRIFLIQIIMRITIIIVLLSLSIFNSLHMDAQQTKINSLRNDLTYAKADSTKIEILTQLGLQYWDVAQLDSSTRSFQQALDLLQKNNHSIEHELDLLSKLDYNANVTGNFPLSIKYATKALELSEQTNNTLQTAFALSVLGRNYSGMGDLRIALDYFFRAKKVFETYESGHWAIQNIAETYLKMHKVDSAMFYNRKAAYIADTGQNQQYMAAYATRVFGSIYAEKGENRLALKYYRQFITDFYNHNLNNREIGHVYFGMAKLFQEKKQIDSSIFYAEKALASAKIYSDHEHIFNSSDLLYHLYDSLQIENKAYAYYKTSVQAKESMAIRQAQNLAFNEQIREKEKLETDIKKAQRTKLLIIISALIVAIITFLAWNRIRQLRLKHKMILEQKETEKLKTKYEKDLLKLEAKALRAQMNPHFIFNCLNSIKSLINRNENDKAAAYLITFSKLIRTLFQNSDKREVSLFEELETCKFYTQLEKLRFDDKVEFVFDEDINIDLKDIKLPALILQPFIENAIWHGLVPKGSGGKIIVSIKEKNNTVECIIDDNGIGRELSKQYKAQYESTRQSKGIGLTQTRLELDKILNDREDSLEIIDKISESGAAEGTKVIITFKEIGN